MEALKLSSDYFAGRGISDATLAFYRVEYVEYSKRPAVIYPTKGNQTSTGYRIKYIDNVKPKYAWTPSKPDDCIYYSVGKLKDAIAANMGKVYILNGEPAIWAFHSYLVAGGWDKEWAAPAISWFGEGSVPLTLFDDMEKLGVKHMVVIPDCDRAGFESALKVNELFGNAWSTIGLEYRRLPFEFGSGEDFNDLWMSEGFLHLATRDQLDTLPFLRPDQMRVALGVKSSVAEVKPKEREVTTSNSDIDFKTMEHEWIALVIAALGQPAKREGKIDRWHCPVHPDKDPSFRVEYNAGEYPRPRCTCDIHRHLDAWDQIARAVKASSWENYRREKVAQWHKEHPEADKQKGAQDVTPLKIVQAQPLLPAPAAVRVSRVAHYADDTMDALVKIIDGDIASIGNPVPSPMMALRHLGGLCRVIPSGKIIGVIGGSGEGKTSLLETWNDFWNKLGLDTINRSPEWSPLEIAMRRIQRYSGRAPGQPHVSVEDITAWILWQKEAGLGIPEVQRQGKPLSKAQLDEVKRVKAEVSKWPGKSIVLSEDDSQELFLEELLDLIASTLDEGRKAGRRRDIVIFDYVQLLKLRDVRDGEREVEQVVSIIKNHVARYQYVAVLGTQVTKSSSKQQKTAGAVLTSDDAQYLRSDKFNLMLSINRVYEEREGQSIPTDYSTIYVDKHSLGVAHVNVSVETDFKHLLWKDKAK
jgi:hypothetical protein